MFDNAKAPCYLAVRIDPSNATSTRDDNSRKVPYLMQCAAMGMALLQ